MAVASTRSYVQVATALAVVISAHAVSHRNRFGLAAGMRNRISAPWTVMGSFIAHRPTPCQ
jgi:hypothetical protein